MFAAISVQLCAFRGAWEAFDTMAHQSRAMGAPTPYVQEGLFVGRARRDPNPEIQERVLKTIRDELARRRMVLRGPVVPPRADLLQFSDGGDGGTRTLTALRPTDLKSAAVNRKSLARNAFSTVILRMCKRL